MEHETMKLKQQEEAYSRELKEWKAQLKPRKQVKFFLHWRENRMDLLANLMVRSRLIAY